MKREELEIGDWVYLNSPFDASYAQIIDKFYHIMLTKRMNGSVASCSTHYLEPIPITEDILRSNGFTQVGGSDSPLWEYDNFAIVKICDEWKIRVVTFLATTYTVRYVHELQQVMRKICDNKYIDNQIFL